MGAPGLTAISFTEAGVRLALRRFFDPAVFDPAVLEPALLVPIARRLRGIGASYDKIDAKWRKNACGSTAPLGDPLDVRHCALRYGIPLCLHRPRSRISA